MAENKKKTPWLAKIVLFFISMGVGFMKLFGWKQEKWQTNEDEQ